MRSHVLGVLVLEAPVPVVGDAEVGKRRRGLGALVKDVVDHRDGPRVVVGVPVLAVLGRDDQRDETRVPVVGDKHNLVTVRPFAFKVDLERRLARGVRQERVPELVIGPRLAFQVDVDATRSFVAVVLDEDKVNPVVHLVHEPNLVGAAEEANLGVGARIEGTREVLILLRSPLVVRRYHHHAVPALDELTRQRSAHVGESTGF